MGIAGAFAAAAGGMAIAWDLAYGALVAGAEWFTAASLAEQGIAIGSGASAAKKICGGVADIAEGAAGRGAAGVGRGSTANLGKGTTIPRNLREQLAVEEAMTNPGVGEKLDLPLGDPRWPASDGWKKMVHRATPGGGGGDIEVHYVWNPGTGKTDDYKVVVPGRR